MSNYYKIVEAQLPLIGGLAGHDLLVVLNPAGQVIQDFEGLATGSTGIKSIGYLPSDKLVVYDHGYNYADHYNSNESQALVASSTTLAGLQPYINAMTTCMNAMNAEGLSYPFLGLGANSNSVASTLDACMGLPEPFIPNSAPITPGVGTLLLPTSTISSIQTANGLNHSSTAGDSAVSGESTGAASSTVDVADGDGASEVATITENRNDNGSIVQFTDRTSTGAVKYTDQETVSSSGANSEIITGTGATLADAPGYDVIVSTGASVTEVGSGGALSLQTSSRGVGSDAVIDGSDTAISITGGSSVLTLAAGTSENKIEGTGGITIDVGNNADAVIDSSNNNNISLGSDDKIDANGHGNIISASNDIIDLGAGDSVTVTGAGDTIVGMTSDSITVTGTNDKIFADSSTIEINGADTGDVVSGSGDTGDRSDWGGYVAQGGGYGGYGGGGYYDAARSIKPFPAKVASMSGDIARMGAADIEAIGASDHGPQIILGRNAGDTAFVNSSANIWAPARSGYRTTTIDTNPVAAGVTAQTFETGTTPQLMADQLIHAMATWPVSAITPMFSALNSAGDTVASQFLTKPLGLEADTREHARAA